MIRNEAELLDHFAGLAMQAIRMADVTIDSDKMAAWAYIDADAMLAERAKRMQPADLTELPFGGAK